MNWSKEARERIKDARRERGWSQKRLADEVTRVRGESIAQRTIASIELGLIRIELETLDAIATAVGKPLEYFLPDRSPRDLARREIDVLIDQLSLDDLQELRRLALVKLEMRQESSRPKAVSHRQAQK